MKHKYINQINRAIDYIMENLDEELDVTMIAAHCHFSKYHFSRLFKSVVGESVYSFVKRLRIERSALLLNVAPNESITEIGAKFGYSSSNFSSLFKQRYRQSPASFRKNSRDNGLYYTDMNDYVDYKKKVIDYYNSKIDFIELPDLHVIYERHIGKYVDCANNWTAFFDKVKGYINEDTFVFDISHDDPVITDEKRCIYDMCVTVDKNVSDFSSKVIKGGMYASYSFEGHPSKILEAYQSILKVWLPYSRVALDDRKILSKYTGGQKKHNIKMDICIPIK